MRRRSLRFRLVAASLGAILAAVLALALVADLLFEREVRSSLDAALRARAVAVARLAVSAPALLDAPGALEAPAGGRQLTVEVLDRRGRIVARSGSLGGRLLPAGELARRAIASGRSGYRDARLDAEPIRVFAAPVARAGGAAGGGAVLVSSSLRETEDTLARLRRLDALAALAALLVGAAAALWLTTRGLRPLRRLAAAAGEIERTGDLGRRLPEEPVADEVGELARTLNRMLGALERARATERRFLADASHELRTPLTALRGNAAYVARHGADPEALADLEADSARLGRLLEDLLALEREGGATPPAEPVALDELVARVATGDDIDLEIAGPAVVRGEPGALERALANLIDNARAHGPAGGRVAVRLAVAGGTARLSVTDEGPGLAPAEAARAFDRFWRGPQAAGRPGSGLGLAIVRATAERHGGRVEVDGARFTLTLPVVLVTASTVSGWASGAEPGGGRREPS